MKFFNFCFILPNFGAASTCMYSPNFKSKQSAKAEIWGGHRTANTRRSIGSLHFVGVKSKNPDQTPTTVPLCTTMDALWMLLLLDSFSSLDAITSIGVNSWNSAMATTHANRKKGKREKHNREKRKRMHTNTLQYSRIFFKTILENSHFFARSVYRFFCTYNTRIPKARAKKM